MTAKQIREQMTQGEWVVNDKSYPYTIIDGAVTAWNVDNISDKDHAGKANGAAITTAVNSTYNAGYDPVALLSFVRAFEEFAEKGTFTRTYPNQGKTLNGLLKAAKI